VLPHIGQNNKYAGTPASVALTASGHSVSIFDKGTSMNLHRNSLVAAAVAATLLSSRLMAADAVVAAEAAVASDVADSDSALSEVIVTGTRTSGLKATDSPAPVQVIDSEQLNKTAATPDLSQTLGALVPSLEVANTGGDLSALTLQVALRSLSPNDTLVLINGKRRHTTSNIDVAGTDNFGGGAGADLNLIPADAIDHVEVLTDGAAAQYGSDAIGGVINIILKKDPEGGNLQASYGGYQDGGGKTDDVTGNIGFQPYDGSYINFTGEFRNHGHTVRSGAIPFIAALQDGLAAGQAVTTGAGLQTIDLNAVNADGYPILNKISGDAEYQSKLASFNSGFRLTDAVEFYSFGTWGQKSAAAYENYRLPHIAAYTPAPIGGVAQPTDYFYPYGFTPEEAIDENDYGLTGGLRGVLAGWNWDVSSTYGRDVNQFYTDDSVNTTAFAKGVTNAVTGYSSPAGYSPTTFYDGLFKTTQWTSNLDLDHEFDVGLAGPLNVALGAEHRRDAFTAGAGIPLSYLGGGGASFAGFSPTDAGGHSRSNDAGYVDLAAKVIGGLRLDIAGRYEDFSDFGSARSGKFTARYDFSPAFALRGTISNGFRAPTVAEEYYTKTSTSPTSTGVQLGANTPAAAVFGLGQLQPETSVNYSLGAVFTPVPELTATLDVSHINLDHRIVTSQDFYSLIANGTNSAGVQQPAYGLVTSALNINGNQLNPAIFTDYVSFFLNGVDTSTDSVDLALDYATQFGEFGKVDWSLNANYNHTEIDSVRASPQQLATLGLSVLNPTGFNGLTIGQPKYNIQLGGLWSYQKLTVNLREVVHDTTANTTTVAGNGVQSLYNTKSGVIPITNLDIGYNVLKSVTLSIGAVNLFNRYPDKVPEGLVAYYTKLGQSFGATQYAASPIGIDGGYYYVKATYNF
jgi:iron complex outermembrane receptor protein